jgi:hypothetical protein
MDGGSIIEDGVLIQDTNEINSFIVFQGIEFLQIASPTVMSVSLFVKRDPC